MKVRQNENSAWAKDTGGLAYGQAAIGDERENQGSHGYVE